MMTDDQTLNLSLSDADYRLSPLNSAPPHRENEESCAKNMAATNLV